MAPSTCFVLSSSAESCLPPPTFSAHFYLTTFLSRQNYAIDRKVKYPNSDTREGDRLVKNLRDGSRLAFLPWESVRFGLYRIARFASPHVSRGKSAGDGGGGEKSAPLSAVFELHLKSTPTRTLEDGCFPEKDECDGRGGTV